MKLLKTLPFILAFISLNAQSLGVNGHRIVARIAAEHLTVTAKANLEQITGGQHLAQLSTWPDEIRSDSAWDHSHSWHYLSIDDDESFDGLKRSDKGDVLEALARFEKQLTSPDVAVPEKKQALAFYIHFFGDIHQPLHVGRRDDRGGNDIKVDWFREPSNLHRVWDSAMIERQQLSYSEYAAFLDTVAAKKIKQWQSANYLDYAKESKQLRAQVYNLSELSKLSYDYNYKNINTLNQRMQQAGIRLAGKLNAIFGR